MRFFTPLLLLASLAACTASRPPAYNLPAADTLVPGETYTVGRNENIYAIAQKQGVKMRDIIALNTLKPPFALRAGETLTLPNKDRFAAPTPKAAPLEYVDKGYMAPSKDGAIGTTEVMSAPLDPPSTPAPAAAKTQFTNTPATAPTPLPPADTKALSAASAAPLPQQEPAQIINEDTAKAAPTPATSNSLSGETLAFGWPVRGTIISAFGPKGKGLDNDGINIAAPKGSPVKAAAGGIVAYSGNEMKGFGNLVLIRHEGGWVTAYAHLERLVVARDAVVAKGDMIGTVGTSGGVSSPQLHFETRREGKPVDPELVIK